MAKRKTPERYKTGPKKGQFKPKSARSSSSRKRKAPAKRRTARRNPGRTVARKRSAPRRNPPKILGGNIVGNLMDAGIEAGQILVGKAAARSIPDLAGLPKQGNVGLAIQTAVALATGWAASMFMSPNAARAITAGGLTAPLETLVVAYRIPWLSEALAPVTANAELGAYVQGRARALPPRSNGNGNGVGAYVRRSMPERGLGSYARG